MMKSVHIEGMRCGGCAARGEKAIGEPGYEAKVDLETGTAAVTGDNICECTLRRTVEGLKFTITGIEK